MESAKSPQTPPTAAEAAGIPKWMLTRSFAILVLLLVGGTSIPFAIYMLVTTPELRLVGFSTGVLFFLGWLAIMYYKIKENRDLDKMARDYTAFTMRMEEESYKCIRPQIPGSWVTVPIRVTMRGVPASRIVELKSDVMEVHLANVRNLEGEIDQEKALKNLVHAALNDNRFAVQVRIGGGRRHAGPTGLGVLIGFKDFGTDLGYTVGQMLEAAARRGVSA